MENQNLEKHRVRLESTGAKLRALSCVLMADRHIDKPVDYDEGLCFILDDIARGLDEICDEIYAE